MTIRSKPTTTAMPDSTLSPLCVDLDGTLTKTDLLVESFFLLLGKHPLLVLFVPFWLLRGKARLKQELARRVELDVATLPYHPAFLAWLREQHAQGRHLVLATSAAESFARQVADHLGIFSQVVATTDDANLSGSRKAERLCERFGERGFDYAGNGMVDVTVWARARQAILVNPARGVREQAAQGCRDHRRVRRPRGRTTDTMVQGAALAPMAEKRAGVRPSAGGASRAGIRLAAASGPGLSRFRPVRLQCLSVERSAGFARRPPASAQAADDHSLLARCRSWRVRGWFLLCWCWLFCWRVSPCLLCSPAFSWATPR